MYIPKRIVIETVFGCNASCSQCIVELPSIRSKGVMKLADFKSIVAKLIPYVDSIEKIDLFGLGEPLIDKTLEDKVSYLKHNGFRNIAFSSNADLLAIKRQKRLLEAGLDTIIISIDGVDEETHDAIRIGTSFSRVIQNTKSLIQERNRGGYKTKIKVRFIAQESNHHQWGDYINIWKQYLDESKGDAILHYAQHGWSGRIGKILERHASVDDEKPCQSIFEKLVILANGDVALCFEDILNPDYALGNVYSEDPIVLFNSDKYSEIRRRHFDGERRGMHLCNKCEVAQLS